MKRLDKSALLRIWEKLRRTPGGLMLVLGFCLFLFTYVISKQQETKIVTYKNAGADFSTGRTVSRNNDLYQRKDKIYHNKVQNLEEQLAAVTRKLDEYQAQLEATKKTEPQETELPSAKALTPPAIAPPVRDYPTATVVSNVVNGTPRTSAPEAKNRARVQATPKRAKSPQIISFPVKSSERKPDMGVKLPSGSFVKAKLLTGIEAPEGKALPVLLQADYAFIGPNKSRVDLSGCFLIAKSTGNLSIERVEMQTTKISCVAKSGRMFERQINGYVADGKDNSFAVMGSVNSKRDRVASMAFLSSVVDGIGKAVSQAQTTTNTSDSGNTSTMITGDQGKYIAASGASSAVSTITSWYLKHAEGLLPTINVGSGQEVWVIMQDSVSLPNWYFRRHFDEFGGVSFLSNILK